MLKHARNYLKDKYIKTKGEFKKIQTLKEEYEMQKAKIQEGERYIKAHRNKNNAKSDLMGDIIASLLVGFAVSCMIIILTTPFTIPFYIAFLFLLASVTGRIAFSINKVKKANQNIEEVKKSITLFDAKELENINEFENKTLRKIKDEAEDNEFAISHLNSRLTEDLEVLWSILSSDNFIESLNHYKDYNDDIAQSLTAEWTGYLEEQKK